MTIQSLNNIREPGTGIPPGRKIGISILTALAGALLGVFQKWIDSGGDHELPAVFQALDIRNFFGRLGIWLLLGTIISVYASSPKRAAVNTFLFFISMVSGYYVYCHFFAGFLPVSYMMIWVALSVVSPLLAFICWYAKGRGAAAIGISAVILGVIFSQAFLITQGFFVTHLLEVIVWIAALIILRREPKEFAIEAAASLGVAVVYQLVVPYWG